jgi:hypothetical protein
MSIRHSVDNLCYQLIEGEVCLEPLRVLTEREIVWQGLRIGFFILGASHAVTLAGNGVCIAELLTCLPQTVTSGLLAQCAANRPLTLCPDVPGMTCRIQIAPFALAEDDKLHLAVADTDTLSFAYPPMTEQETPLTRLGWQVMADSLHIETVHTYPEEQQGVRTTTVFTREMPKTLF